MDKTVIIEFLKEHAAEIVWIVVLFFCAKIVLKLFTKHLVKLVDDGNDDFISRKEKRARTLGQIIRSIGNITIYSIILFMLLNLSGVDIRPILASAGIVGLAVGFGAQSLVKDCVSGLFILIENQYAVGDKVKIGAFEGDVIKITIRSTILRDIENNIYYISNGSINNAINLTQKKMYEDINK